MDTEEFLKKSRQAFAGIEATDTSTEDNVAQARSLVATLSRAADQHVHETYGVPMSALTPEFYAKVNSGEYNRANNYGGLANIKPQGFWARLFGG